MHFGRGGWLHERCHVIAADVRSQSAGNARSTTTGRAGLLADGVGTCAHFTVAPRGFLRCASRPNGTGDSREVRWYNVGQCGRAMLRGPQRRSCHRRNPHVIGRPAGHSAARWMPQYDVSSPRSHRHRAAAGLTTYRAYRADLRKGRGDGAPVPARSPSTRPTVEDAMHAHP